jgi:hypothetical protein
VSGRMNWDRVNRENRAWRAARRAPSGNWEPDYSWQPYDSPMVDRWPGAGANPRRPKTEDKDSTVPRGIGSSRAGRRRRRRRKRADIQRWHARVR